MNKDLLFVKIAQRAANGMPIVMSPVLKNDLNADGVPWGSPHGWRIRDAEDREFMSLTPRLAKWRVGPGSRGMIAYSLVNDLAATQLAQQSGFVRLR